MIDGFAGGAIDDIYAAALDVSLWPKALHSLARSVDGAGAVLLPCTVPAAVLNFTSHELMEGARIYVQEEWWKQDAPLAYTIANDIRSGFFADSDIIPPETLKAHPFFNEFLKRYGSGRVTSIISTPVPGHTVAITTHREGWRGDMSESERRTYRTMGHHASRAAAIALSLASSRAKTEDLAAVLDEVPSGIALLDRFGHVVYASRKLNALKRFGLTVALKKLTVRGSDNQGTLDAMISTAAAARLGLAHDFFLLRRPPPDRPVMLRVVPVRGRSAAALEDFFRTRLVMVMAIDLNVGSDPMVVRGFQALGLTLAESRLAALVGAGKSPREASAELGIKENTARIQLKQVFAKLDIHRQGDLTAITTKLTFPGE
jgi:DNA-binding CsgD family transcriptional regulator